MDFLQDGKGSFRDTVKDIEVFAVVNDHQPSEKKTQERSRALKSGEAKLCRVRWNWEEESSH